MVGCWLAGVRLAGALAADAAGRCVVNGDDGGRVAWHEALENGLNHGQQALEFGTKQEDTLHVADHHS